MDTNAECLLQGAIDVKDLPIKAFDDNKKNIEKIPMLLFC